MGINIAQQRRLVPAPRRCGSPAFLPLSLTAESVAKEFGISRDELQRMLLCLVEKNFDSFLNYVRVQQACRLLTTTAATITSIAIEVGYNTVKSFTRNFLRFMVMTPSSYRKAAQGAMGK